MSEICEFSRSRWYELVEAGIFPPPVMISPLKRPIYDRDLIAKCLEIKKTGVGFNGQPVVWNRKNQKGVRKPQQKPSTPHTTEICEAIKALGLNTNVQSVTEVLLDLYPDGFEGHDRGEVIRNAFLKLQGKRP